MAHFQKILTILFFQARITCDIYNFQRPEENNFPKLDNSQRFLQIQLTLFNFENTTNFTMTVLYCLKKIFIGMYSKAIQQQYYYNESFSTMKSFYSLLFWRLSIFLSYIIVNKEKQENSITMHCGFTRQFSLLTWMRVKK